MPEKAGLDFLGMSAMASAAEGISIARVSEPEQPLVFVNQGFVEMTGYSYDECVHKNCRFLQGPDTDRQSVDSIRNAIKNRQKLTVELLNYTKMKEPFWNRLTLAPIAKEPGGAEDYYVGIQFNVTEYKIMQKKIQHYADRMKRINENADEGIRVLTEQMMKQSSQAVQMVDKLMSAMSKRDDSDTLDDLQTVKSLIGSLNETISSLKVVMHNCGGIDGFLHVDPVTLKVREAA